MDAATQKVREVHDTLLPLLAEAYGDELQILDATAPEAGKVKYGFSDDKFVCDIGVNHLSDRAAAVCARARLGRCYTGYRRALRWLACNRANNTVALSVDSVSLSRRELWVCGHRVTLPGDGDGIREFLTDFHDELARLSVGLVWFPQLVEARILMNLESADQSDDGEVLQMILTDPQGYCDWLQTNRQEALEQQGVLAAEVLGWLGRWKEQLEYIDEHFQKLSAEEQANNRTGYLKYRIIALGQTGQYQQLLDTVGEMEQLPASCKNLQVSVVARMRALCGLGQHEEALDAGRGVAAEDIPRTWYWRCIAQASLGQYQNAVESFRKYENMICADIFAHRALRKLIPEDWKPDENELQ